MEQGTDRERDSWMRVMSLHYASQIVSPGVLLVSGGATPVSHSVVMGLLPWQPQSNSLANITVGLWREQGADFDGQQTSNCRFTLTEREGRQRMKN